MSSLFSSLAGKRPAGVTLSVMVIACLLGAAYAHSPESASRLPVTQPPDPPPPLSWQQPPAMWEPLRPRTERVEDRLIAQTHFMQARRQMRRGDLTGTLRNWQRAWRYDPALVSLLEQVVPLAARLQRAEEAARYAVLAAEREMDDPEMISRVAILLVEREEYDQARTLMERARRLLPDTRQHLHAVVHFEAGRLRFLDEDFAGALDAWKVVVEAIENPSSFQLTPAEAAALQQQHPQLLRLMGEANLVAGRPDEARERFRAAQEADPHDGQWHVDTARCFAAAGEFTKALDELEQALEELDERLGVEPLELLELWHAEEAVPASDTAARLMEIADSKAELPSVGYFVARALERQGRHDEALERYRALVEDDPAVDGFRGMARLLAHRFRAASMENDTPEEAERVTAEMWDILVRLVELTGSLDPLGPALSDWTEPGPLRDALLQVAESADSVESAWAGALLAADGDRPALSEELWQRAVSLAEDDQDQQARVLWSWALTWLLAEEYPRSIEPLERLQAHPVTPVPRGEVLFQLAGAYQMAGRTDEALELARQVRQSEPQSARMGSRLAWVYFAADRYEDADRAYRQVLALHDARHDDAQHRRDLVLVRRTLSNVCLELDRDDDAVEWLEQILDEFPDDDGALNDLGYLWADRNEHLERALGMIQRAVEHDPENSAYRDSLGWVLFRLERIEEAVVELERAAADEEAGGVVLDHLGDAYLAARRPDEARRCWRDAAAAFSREGERDEANRVRAKLNSSSSE